MSTESVKVTREEPIFREFSCPCGAKMQGSPILGQSWYCADGHQFIVKDGNLRTPKATAVNGAGGGKHPLVRRIYSWPL